MSFVSNGTMNLGSQTQFTLDYAALASSGLITDSYYQNQANIKEIRIVYRSNPGRQIHVVQFPLSQLSSNQITGAVKFSSKSRNAHEVVQILAVDYDGGMFPIRKPALTTHGVNFDLDIANGGIQNGGLVGDGNTVLYSQLQSNNVQGFTGLANGDTCFAVRLEVTEATTFTSARALIYNIASTSGQFHAVICSDSDYNYGYPWTEITARSNPVASTSLPAADWQPGDTLASKGTTFTWATPIQVDPGTYWLVFISSDNQWEVAEYTSGSDNGYHQYSIYGAGVGWEAYASNTKRGVYSITGHKTGSEHALIYSASQNGGMEYNGQFFYAIKFDIEEQRTLSRAKMLFHNASGSPHSGVLKASIYSDAGGYPSGPISGTQSDDADSSQITAPYPPTPGHSLTQYGVAFNWGTHPRLEPGTYWLVIDTTYDSDPTNAYIPMNAGGNNSFFFSSDLVNWSIPAPSWFPVIYLESDESLYQPPATYSISPSISYQGNQGPYSRFNISFSEVVSGFNPSSQLVVHNGTLSNVQQQSSTSYDLFIAPDGLGQVEVTLPQGSVTRVNDQSVQNQTGYNFGLWDGNDSDGDGQYNDQDPYPNDPTNGAGGATYDISVNFDNAYDYGSGITAFDISFSENVQNVDTNAITVVPEFAGSLSPSISVGGSDANWTIFIQMNGGYGNCSITMQQGAAQSVDNPGHYNSGNTSGFTVDPPAQNFATTITRQTTAPGPIPVSLSFANSQQLVGVSMDSIEVVNGQKYGFAQNDVNNTSFYVVGGYDGESIEITVPEGIAYDSTNGHNLSQTQTFTYTVDPSMVVTGAISMAAGATTFHNPRFGFVGFDGWVQDLDVTNFSFQNCTVQDFNMTYAATGGYLMGCNFRVYPTNAGSCTLSVSAIDANGNPVTTSINLTFT